jgi:uncharacterized protein DUF4382
MPKLARPRFLLELVLALGACGGVEEPSARVGVAVRATAAFDVGDEHAAADAAVLAIDRIELVPRAGEPVVLRDEPLVLDLSTLGHDAELVAEGLVPAARYQALRLVLGSAYLVIAGEGIFSSADEALVPAGAFVAGDIELPRAPEIDVALPQPELGNDARDLEVRVDVAQSFRHAQGDSRWALRPVLEAVDPARAAKIAVRVDVRTLAGANRPMQVRVRDGAGRAETQSDAVGDRVERVAQIPFLTPGDGPFTIELCNELGEPMTTMPSLPVRLPVMPGDDFAIDVMALGVEQ